MVMKTKGLLITGFLLVSLISVLLWLFGLRIEHVRFLILSLSEPPKLSTEERTELHTWLKEDAVHLNSVEAGSGFEDMQPLKAMIADARIVALEEASHLNREFYQVKHRMVEFLVDEMDFTVFAIEATFTGALELNDYVLTGNGDPQRALAALVYPAWNTEEGLALVNWMREYNSTHEKKVKFYGFDNKPATGSAKAVYRYLRKTNGTNDYDQVLSIMMNPWTAGQLNSGPKEEIHGAKKEIKSLITHLERQQPAYAQRTPSEQEIQDQKEWKLAGQHARVLLQHVRFYGAPSISKASDLRDRSMAQNVRWLMDYEDGANDLVGSQRSRVGNAWRGVYGLPLASDIRQRYYDCWFDMQSQIFRIFDCRINA
jgi:erythromycin esterase